MIKSKVLNLLKTKLKLRNFIKTLTTSVSVPSQYRKYNNQILQSLKENRQLLESSFDKADVQSVKEILQQSWFIVIAILGALISVVSMNFELLLVANIYSCIALTYIFVVAAINHIDRSRKNCLIDMIVDIVDRIMKSEQSQQQEDKESIPGVH